MFVSIMHTHILFRGCTFQSVTEMESNHRASLADSFVLLTQGAEFSCGMGMSVPYSSAYPRCRGVDSNHHRLPTCKTTTARTNPDLLLASNYRGYTGFHPGFA